MKPEQTYARTRAEPTDELNYRTLSIRKDAPANGAPASLDRKARSVEVVAATETPVRVFDWERYESVDEVLLMSGLKLPGTRKIPLLDSHSRYSSADVLGSARDLRVVGGELLARAVFSTVQRAEEALVKLDEGHLTDFSVGYRVNQSVYVPESQSQVVGGRTFAGPVRIATDWTVKELSITPIGADERAKARSASPKREEKTTMDKKTREFLIKRGLAAEATDEQAWAYLETLDIAQRTEPVTPATPAAPVINEDAIREEAVRSEQARILEIRALCDRFGCGTLADEAITKRQAVDEVRKLVLDHVSKGSVEGHGYRPPAEMLHDERDKFRAVATDALIMRGGLTIEKPTPGADDFRSYSLRELARECLRRAGQPVPSNVLDMVGRALTTGDLPNILAATANKYLFEGYSAQPETWQVWCATGSVADFKANTLNRASETDDLDLINEGSEYKYGGMTDAKETYTLLTYGKAFAIYRQTIINDDLNALTDIPRKHGEAAARKVGDLPYAVLTANAAMGDGVVLFHSTHANVMSSAVLSAASLADGIKLMKVQKDIGGKQRLNIRAEYAIAPAALEGTWEQFFNSGMIGGATATDAGRANLVNPYGGTRFTRVYDARLDDSSASHWYLAGPKGKTITVFFLNGVQAPYMEMRQGWSVDGVEYKVRIDAVAKAVDWKAMAYNAV